MLQYLQPAEFLSLADSYPVVDVRAPLEFAKGHIPGATNIPLFDDSERETVGKAYRKFGQQQAILKGLEIVGPKMQSLAQQALQIATQNSIEPDQKPAVLLHCARGGMRSQSMSWLLQQVNLDPQVLQGGYKAYRQHVLKAFEIPLNPVVISGLTGAGKTRQIANLQSRGEQVIDLEGLANHRGSAFGGIGQPKQPTVEQFENEIHCVLRNVNRDRRIWLEDESRKVGLVIIPPGLYQQIKAAPAIFMDVDRTVRARLIIEEYGELSVEEIKLAIERITKRLGGQNVIAATDAIHRGDLAACVDILLEYYDKSYLNAKSRQTRDVILNLPTDNPDSAETTDQLIAIADTLVRQAPATC